MDGVSLKIDMLISGAIAVVIECVTAGFLFGFECLAEFTLPISIRASHQRLAADPDISTLEVHRRWRDVEGLVCPRVAVIV